MQRWTETLLLNRVKIFFLVPIVASTLTVAHGQNLVPNASFEYLTSCPDDQNQIYKSQPWYDPQGYILGSDYFNTCFTTGIWNSGIPNNNWGQQNPRTGNAYSGVWAYGGWANPTVREYIAVHLLDSLIKDKYYCVKFYLSLAGPSTYGVDAIALYFSKDSVYDSTTSWLPYSPQVINQGNIIMDTLNWVLIQGTYVAGGGEKYICIGNFYDNSNTNADSTTTTAQPGGSYYYIDDVSIIDSGFAGVDEQLGNNYINIYSNPFSVQTILQSVNPFHNATLTVENCFGQTVAQIKNISGQTVTFNRDNLPSGLYFVRLTEENKIYTGKLVITDK